MGFNPAEDKIEKHQKQFSSKKLIFEVIQQLITSLKSYGISTQYKTENTLLINNKIVLQVTVISRTNAHPGHRVFFGKDFEIILALSNEKSLCKNHCDMFVFPKSISNSRTFYVNKKQTFEWFSKYRTSWDSIVNDLILILNSMHNKDC